MADIFLSYAREDLTKARQLAEAFEAEGWSVFWDRTIPAGRDWWQVIGVALEEARCVVVAWSEAGLSSNWVREEADDGRKRDVLVPVLFEPVVPPIGFRTIQAQDLSAWDGAATAPAFRSLVNDLALLLGPSPEEVRRKAEAERQQQEAEREAEERRKAALERERQAAARDAEKARKAEVARQQQESERQAEERREAQAEHQRSEAEREAENKRRQDEEAAARAKPLRAAAASDMRPNHSPVKPVPKKSNFVPLAVLGALVLGVAIVWFASRGVAVPDLRSVSLDAARSRLEAAGLSLGRVREVSDDAAPAGMVVRQVARAGERLPRGTAVELVVSVGPPGVQVPDVVGMRLEAARAELVRSGLELGRVMEMPDERTPAGSVARQVAHPGGRLRRGTEVDLVMSLGPPPRIDLAETAPSVAVPELVSLSLEHARAVLREAGLTLGRVDEQPGAPGSAGTVMDQASSPGERRPRGAPVDVVVSLGAVALEGPEVREAQALLTRLDYDPGPVDGIAGERTVAAIEAFQRSRGLPGDGRTSPATLEALHAAVAEAAPVAPAAPIELPEMVRIPGGTFQMGSPDSDEGRSLRSGEEGRKESLAIAKELQQSEPEAAVGYVLEGDNLLAAGDTDAAVAAYEKALSVQPTTGALLKLYAAHRQNGDNASAVAVLDDWLKKYPQDAIARVTMASERHQSGERVSAIAQYEKVLESQPGNILALNNLAWLYHENKDARAIDLAKRAYDALPERPEIMDTYGWLLVEAGQVERGLKLLSRAADGSPENGDIVYHHAAALSRAGDPARAKNMLKDLLDKGTKFPERRSAEALFAEL